MRCSLLTIERVIFFVMKRSARMAQVFENHVGNFCMELIKANYDTIINDPFFTNMSLLIKDNADSHLSELLAKYMVIENPGDISILIEVGYYDIAFDGTAINKGERKLHIIQLNYLYKGEAIQPVISAAQSSIYQDEGDAMPEIFMLDVLKECIAQHTAQPTMYIEDYR